MMSTKFALMRIVPVLLIALWLLAFAAPTWVMVRFQADRARIIRDECVQRDMPDELRTCFGRCQLIKSLNDLRDQEQHGTPAASLVKWEPEAISEHRTVRTACDPFLAIAEPVQFEVRVLSGHVRLLEGVPRS